MRLAVISHACVVDLNQRLYQELARHEDIDLLLIAPVVWRASTGRLIHFRTVPEANFRAHPLPVWGSGQISLHWYRGLGPVLRDFAPDLIYLDEEAYSLPAWQVLRLAKALSRPMAFVHTQNILKRQPWPFSAVERAVLDYACLANPLTEKCVQVLRAKQFRGQIVLIPHCVDTQRFYPQPQPQLRESLGLTDFVVGFLGRLTEEKGIEDLMAAAELLWAGALRFHLLVVGSGPLQPRLSAWAQHRRFGDVSLVGAVAHDAVPDYLNAMDVLVMPSRTTPGWKEQFGRVLIEALACAVPVIGSDSGNIPTLLREVGGGVIFPERDPQALVAALKPLIEQPARARELGEAGRAGVLNSYAVTAVAERLYQALRAVVG